MCLLGLQAGHAGLQPLKAASGEDEAKYSSLPLNRVIDVMEKADTQTSIIILDACRDNPFERVWARSTAPRGLAPVYSPRGSLIALQHADKGEDATQLLADHAALFWGPLAEAHDLTQLLPATPIGAPTTWRWNFLQSLRISNS